MSLETVGTSVTLDTLCNEPVQVVKAKQLDNLTRQVFISILDMDGTPITWDSGVTVEFRVERPDGVLIVNTRVLEASTSSITIRLLTSMLEVSGRALADVRMIDSTTEEVISGGAFYIDVYATAVGKPFTGYTGTNAQSIVLTQEQFDETEKSDSIVYYVKQSDGSVKQYLGNTSVSDLDGLSFVKCTQAEYDAMTSHSENTVYIIVG